MIWNGAAWVVTVILRLQINRTTGEFSSVIIMAISGKDGVFTKLCLHCNELNNNYKKSYS